LFDAVGMSRPVALKQLRVFAHGTGLMASNDDKKIGSKNVG